MAVPKDLYKPLFRFEVNGVAIGEFTSIKSLEVDSTDVTKYRQAPWVGRLADDDMEVTTQVSEEWAAEVDWEQASMSEPSISLRCSVGSEEAISNVWLQFRRWGIDPDGSIPFRWLDRVLEMMTRLGFHVSFNSYASSDTGWSSDDRGIQTMDMKFTSIFQEDE